MTNELENKEEVSIWHVGKVRAKGVVHLTMDDSDDFDCESFEEIVELFDMDYDYGTEFPDDEQDRIVMEKLEPILKGKHDKMFDFELDETEDL